MRASPLHGPIWNKCMKSSIRIWCDYIVVVTSYTLTQKFLSWPKPRDWCRVCQGYQHKFTDLSSCTSNALLFSNVLRKEQSKEAVAGKHQKALNPRERLISDRPSGHYQGPGSAAGVSGKRKVLRRSCSRQRGGRKACLGEKGLSTSWMHKSSWRVPLCWLCVPPSYTSGSMCQSDIQEAESEGKNK